MKPVFFNIDTQNDFMLPNGKLYVKDAESILQNITLLTDLAHSMDMKVINTQDLHTKDSIEISDNPDFKTTFPEHCMIGTEGAALCSASNPKQFGYDNYYIIPWHTIKIDIYKVMNTRNIIIQKDNFDMFLGNKFTTEVLEILDIDTAIVYGVASNVCVDFAVSGLINMGKQVIVVSNAIKGLPGVDENELIKKWQEEGVKLISTKDLPEEISK